MEWKQVLNIAITDDLSVNVEIGIILIALLFISAIIVLLVRNKINTLVFAPEVELSVNLAGIGNVRIKQNHEVAQIAHKAWTEFVTRKAGLKFDPENDVIVEVYDSWKELFGRVRLLIKEIPANKLRDENTQKLVGLLVDALNDGLRPHLTRWQAKYRSWYLNELNKRENEGKPPQEIQKGYPYYDELLTDLIMINQQIISYTNELKKLTN